MTKEELKQEFNKFYEKRRNFYESHRRIEEEIGFEYCLANEMFQYYKQGVTKATKELQAQIEKMKCDYDKLLDEKIELKDRLAESRECY